MSSLIRWDAARRMTGGFAPKAQGGDTRSQRIEAAGAELRFLSPCSPDFNPIEMAFSKRKALLRRAAARTAEVLWDAIGRRIDLIAPEESANLFTATGYEPE